MGSKTTTQETILPEASQEEKDMMSLFNGLLEAQVSRDYDRKETTSFQYNKQGEIDEVNRLLANPPAGADLNDLYKKRADLMEQGGSNVVKYDFTEKPEVKARREAQQLASDKVDKAFFAAAEKLVSGDLSISPTQKKQINALIGNNFQDTMDLLTAKYASAESAVTSAVDRLTASGKADIATAVVQQRDALQQQFKQQERALKSNAELLGRSYTDNDFQRATGDAQASALTSLGLGETGALERLYRSGQAEIGQQIAGLRTTAAGQIGSVKQQEGLARYNLGLNAAQPLQAFGAGSQFAQLQGALSAQQQQNAYAPIQTASSRLGQLGQLRGASASTQTTQPFGVLDILGSLAGAAGAGISGAASFGVL